MTIFFIKKEKIWPSVSWCCILTRRTRRIDKPVTVVNIEKCGKFVEKVAEHSVSKIVHMADNYGHSAEPITCYLALYESFEIERNDEGRGWIRVSENLLQRPMLRPFLKISNTELQCWVVNLHTTRLDLPSAPYSIKKQVSKDFIFCLCF